MRNVYVAARTPFFAPSSVANVAEIFQLHFLGTAGVLTLHLAETDGVHLWGTAGVHPMYFIHFLGTPQQHFFGTADRQYCKCARAFALGIMSTTTMPLPLLLLPPPLATGHV